MDKMKAAGWTRFKPVKGQPILEQDMKKVFRLVDMDKSGAISQLVIVYHYSREIKTNTFITI